MLKDALAILTLHLTARPWNETIAWTANLRGAPDQPVRHRFVERCLHHRPCLHRRHPRAGSQFLPFPDNRRQRSGTAHVDVRSGRPRPGIVAFPILTQSEQRPARAFRLDDENFVLIAAQPDADLEWLENLDHDEVTRITETKKQICSRHARFVSIAAAPWRKFCLSLVAGGTGRTNFSQVPTASTFNARGARLPT